MSHRLTVVVYPGNLVEGVRTYVIAACDCGWHQPKATSAVESYTAYAAHLPDVEVSA